MKEFKEKVKNALEEEEKLKDEVDYVFEKMTDEEKGDFFEGYASMENQKDLDLTHNERGRKALFDKIKDWMVGKLEK